MLRHAPPQARGGGKGETETERQTERERAETNVKLLDVLPPSLARRDFVDRDNVKRPGSNLVLRGHVAVARSDGVCLAKLAVLAVHVVCTGPRIVPHRDAEILNRPGPLLRHYMNVHHFANGRLNLLQSPEEVPFVVYSRKLNTGLNALVPQACQFRHL